MRTKLEVRFVARSPKIVPIIQNRYWEFKTKKDAIKFYRTLYLDGYIKSSPVYIKMNNNRGRGVK